MQVITQKRNLEGLLSNLSHNYPLPLWRLIINSLISLVIPLNNLFATLLSTYKKTI
jgi:hypothetical protein